MKKESQVYGTQLRLNQETNKFELYELEDPENVNERRKKIGLGRHHPRQAHDAKRWVVGVNR